jgi:hypothetical protein
MSPGPQRARRGAGALGEGPRGGGADEASAADRGLTVAVTGPTGTFG